MARRDRSQKTQARRDKGGLDRDMKGGGNLRRVLAMTAVLVAMLGLARLPYQEWAEQWLPEAYRVEIQGRLQHVSDVELLAAVKPYLGIPLWQVDVESVSQDLVQMSWLKDVQINKRWPDVVTVRVTEYQPMAQWGNEQLLDVSGVVFDRPENAEVSGMPWLYSPDEQAGRDLWRSYVRVNEQLAGLNLPVERLWVDERGAWHLRFVNRLELRLGRHERDQRLTRFTQLVPGALGERLAEAAYVDLRYGNGFAVGWAPVDGNGENGKAGQTGENERDV